MSEEIIPIEQQNLIVPPEQQCIISDEKLTGIYDEILGDIKDDTKQVQDIIDNFSDMVINNGDSSSSSKEALVNLLKIKSDLSDKKAKIADLMTRVKLNKSFPPYMSKEKQANITIIESPNLDRKSMIERAKAEKKKENES